MNNRQRFNLAVIFAALVALVFASCDTSNGGGTETHTHQWGNWTQTAAPTCTAAGERTRVCVLDPAHTQTEPVPIDENAHNYQYVPNSGTPPTCEQDGQGNEACTYNPNHPSEAALPYPPSVTM